jgi:CDP-4-dehydro-6-deoxyglucose reductase
LRVTLANSSRSFEVAPGGTVLNAARAAGLHLPHGCEGGNCGACRALLLRGQVSYPSGPPLGLSSAEAEQGFVLLCQAVAHSDLILDLLEQHVADELLIKRLPCRIAKLEPLAHDVMGVHLRLPAAESFTFKAGQYLDVLLPEGVRRSFSIAVPPHDAALLELHVRQVPGGAFSELLFADTQPGRLLSIEGPLGNFYYREPAGTAEALLLGGGTGLAPLLAILRHAIERGAPRRLRLLWGVRSRRDLYALPVLERLAKQAPHFDFDVVLSEPDPDWSGRRGFVHEAALEEMSRGRLDPGALEVYAAGPPAMIHAVRDACAAAGLAADRLYVDSFDYGAPKRQRSSSATKS